jgi:hypothetical protein
MSLEERALLEAFVVDNPELEQLESLLAEFNIFEAIGAVRQELRHSDFLAFLLDPAQNHGLGDIFLKKFLMHVLVDADNPPLTAEQIDIANLQGAIVEREQSDIDILIHDPTNRLVCAIENKIDAVESLGQLDRCRQIVEQEFSGYQTIFIYLTPEGREPADDSHSAYIPFTYNSIAEMVDSLYQTEEFTTKSEPQILMAHYVKMLRRHIVSDSEIAELCRKIYSKHQRALDLIFEHRPDLQLEIANKLKEIIEDAKPNEEFLANQYDYLKRHVTFADAQGEARGVQDVDGDSRTPHRADESSRLIGRDHVTETSRHRLRAFQQNRDE